MRQFRFKVMGELKSKKSEYRKGKQGLFLSPDGKKSISDIAIAAIEQVRNEHPDLFPYPNKTKIKIEYLTIVSSWKGQDVDGIGTTIMDTLETPTKRTATAKASLYTNDVYVIEIRGHKIVTKDIEPQTRVILTFYDGDVPNVLDKFDF